MDVLIFGASGMIGGGALRECLEDPEIAQADLLNYAAIEGRLSGFDACLFCLGVSSAGLTETAYSRVTYDITLAAARTLVRLNPQMTFIYVSAAGADSTGSGRSMWARVKGRTENALLALPFKAAYILRPAVIQPMHGVKSRKCDHLRAPRPGDDRPRQARQRSSHPRDSRHQPAECDARPLRDRY